MMERFKPEVGQVYYYVGNHGRIEVDTWTAETIDRYRYDMGNCFGTKEDCQAKIDRDIDILERIACGQAVVVNIPDGWEVDASMGDSGLTELFDWQMKKGRGHVNVFLQRKPSLAPLNMNLKVYDRRTHGKPDDNRGYWVMDDFFYAYLNEAKEL